MIGLAQPDHDSGSTFSAAWSSCSTPAGCVPWPAIADDHGALRQSAASSAAGRACDRVSSPSITRFRVCVEIRSRSVPVVGPACTASKILRAGGDNWATQGFVAGAFAADVMHPANPSKDAAVTIYFTILALPDTDARACSIIERHRGGASHGHVLGLRNQRRPGARRPFWERRRPTVRVSRWQGLAGLAAGIRRTTLDFQRTGNARCPSSPGTPRQGFSPRSPPTSRWCRSNRIRRSA